MNEISETTKIHKNEYDDTFHVQDYITLHMALRRRSRAPQAPYILSVTCRSTRDAQARPSPPLLRMSASLNTATDGAAAESRVQPSGVQSLLPHRFTKASR